MQPVVEEERRIASRKSRSAPKHAGAKSPRARETRRNLRMMLIEGVASSFMVGLGESYFAAFVLALRMGQVAAGLVTTIPLVAGGLLQLISPWAVARLGSHRGWAVCCAAAQAASFIPLAIAAWLGTVPIGVIFAIVAIYWGAGLGTSAAWNTWVEALVPERIRPRYFARRTRICQFATLAGFVLGGSILHAADTSGYPVAAFVALFVGASLSRGLSALSLAAHGEPGATIIRPRAVSLREFFARSRASQGGRLLVYFLTVQAAAQIAGPYFTPYMLRTMDLPYVTYVTLIAIAFCTKAVALPACGQFAQSFGTRSLLVIGGLGVVPVSGLWVFSDAFAYLAVIQMLSGVTWAAYELAMFLLFFETVLPEERMGVISIFNFANAIATACGSLLGGALLAYFERSQESYFLVFGLSSAARALTLVVLWQTYRAPHASAESGVPSLQPDDLHLPQINRKAA